MKRRPLYRRRQPTSPFKYILLVILGGRSPRNTIYRRLRQTGLYGLAYKQKIVHAIRTLEKCGLIVDVSGLKRHRSGKEQPVELTAAGRELAELMSSIDHYCTSFSKLTNSITESFSVPYIAGTNKDLHETLEIPITKTQGVDEQKNKVLRSILRNKGWPEEIIDKCSELYRKTLVLRHLLSPEAVLSIVIMRYISILSRSKLNDELDETVKRDIIKEIIMNAISEYLSFMFEEMQKFNLLLQRNGIKTVSTIDIILSDLIEEALGLTIGYISNEEHLNNIFIEKEAINTLASIISISKPNQQYIDKEIKAIRTLQGVEVGEFNNSFVIHEGKILALFEEYNREKNKETNKPINFLSSTS